MTDSQTFTMAPKGLKISHMQCMSEVRWCNGQLQQAWREVQTDENGIAVGSNIIWKRVPSIVDLDAALK